MKIIRTPTTLEKITQMGDVTLYEPAGDTPHAERHHRPQSQSLAECISHLQTPTGKKPVLKTMLTTACERNCYYCPFRAGHSKTRRVTITPDDLARAFSQMATAKQVDGLFLSSGIIKGGVTSQDKIIDTAEIIRRKYRYTGYVHLKIMPGAEFDQLQRAMQLADRISINLEAPTPERMEALAPKKDLNAELIVQLQRAAQIKQQNPRLRTSIVTQFVVGAVSDTDTELLTLSSQLYNVAKLARVYYSAFHPIAGTPFEHLSPASARRELRLYQSSFLLRDYGWDVEDLPFTSGGNLPVDVDPKQAWADAHLRHTPLDIMTADRAHLLRLPGVGPKGADAILNARRETYLREFNQLARLGIRTPERLAPYILFDGKRLPQQLRLFE